ncbi:multidrug effflux MFS transporter [Streptomyces longispororuber]|uniref:multidrug effflux MFS transporter n=1 Tax=Streptomyces longispororuber TaxID=68230 RepID=UPI0033F1E300
MSVGTPGLPPHPSTAALVAVLGALSALSPFATDMYTPAFPEIVTSLGTTAGAVQLSLTACLAGLAVGQVVLGPASDALGRRRVLLAGCAAFAVLSLVCALAPSATVFTVARLAQGVAGSAGLVVARAVVSDRFTGTAAARHLATLSVIAMTAPVLAPVTGGLLLSVGSWRLVFTVLAAAGLALGAAVWAWVPETLPAGRRRGGGLRAAAAATGALLRRRELTGHLLVLGCALAAVFAYITGAPFVFQDGYGLSATAYGLVFAANAAGTVATGVLFARLAGRFPLRVLLAAGVLATAGCALALGVLLAAGAGTLATTWLCLFGLTSGFGLVLPAATTVVVDAGRAAPGAASGLLGGTQFALGAVAAPLPGAWGPTTAASMTAVVAGFVLLSTAALCTLCRPRRACRGPR